MTTVLTNLTQECEGVAASSVGTLLGCNPSATKTFGSANVNHTHTHRETGKRRENNKTPHMEIELIYTDPQAGRSVRIASPGKHKTSTQSTLGPHTQAHDRNHCNQKFKMTSAWLHLHKSIKQLFIRVICVTTSCDWKKTLQHKKNKN